MNISKGEMITMCLCASHSVLPIGGTVYWKRENVPQGKPYYFLPNVYASAEVDITSNFMLGVLRGPELTQEKMDYLSQIATWLSESQNSQGGFTSSQVIRGLQIDPS